MWECEGDRKLIGEISPAGLSMTHWVDAYINILLSNVVQETSWKNNGYETTQDVGPSLKIPKDVQVISFVDKIISQSVSVVLFEENEFASELVWEVLDKASQEIIFGDGLDTYDYNMNEFAREFVHDNIQKIAEEEQDQLNTFVNDFVSEIIQTSVENEYDYTSKDSFSYIMDIKASADTKQKALPGKRSTKLPTSRRQETFYDSTSITVEGVHQNKCVSDSTNRSPLKAKTVTGADYKYIQHRLVYIVGPEVDRSLIEFVMDAIPQSGTWTRKFEAVEKRIRIIEQRKEVEIPLVPEGRLPVSIGGPDCQLQRTTLNNAGHLVVLSDDDIQPVSRKTPVKTKKFRPMFSSPRWILSGIQRSLLRLGFPFFSRRGHRVFVA